MQLCCDDEVLNSRARNVPRIFGCRPAFFSQIDDSAATSSSRRRLRRVLDIKWYHFFTRIKESWCSEYFIPLWRRRLRALSDARSAELARGGAGWVQSLQSHSRVSSSSRAPSRHAPTHPAALAAQPSCHHVPAVVRHRRPDVFLREGPEAIRDPSWSRDSVRP